MVIGPTFARYVKVGNKIVHPTRETVGTVVTVHYTPATETPGRPWGIVSGWMSNPENAAESWGWSYPADQLLFVERG